MALATLSIDLIAKLAKFEEGMSAAVRTSERTAQGIERAFEGVRQAIGALGIAAIVTDQLNGVRAAIDKLDAIDDLSEKYGIAADKLSAYGYASEVAGTTSEAFATGLNKLSKNMADAAGGGKETAAAFAAVGVSVTDANGKLRSADEVLLDLATKFSGYEDGAAKAAAAQAIFGKSGADMIPLLNKGREGIAALTNEAKDFGLVVSNDAAKAAGDFNDNLKRIELAAQSLKLSIANTLLPGLVDLTTHFIKARQEGGLLHGMLVAIGRGIAVTGGFDDLGQLQSKAKDTSAEIERVTNVMVGLSNTLQREPGNEMARRRYENLAGTLRKLQADAQATTSQIKGLADETTKAVTKASEGKPKVDTPVIQKPESKGPKGPTDDPTKALLDNALKDQERYIAAERDLAQQRQRFLDLYNAQGLISVRDYYGARRAIADEALAGQVAGYDREIAALRDSQAKQAKATERAADQGKINELIDKRDKAVRDAGAAGIELTVQQTAAEEALARSIAGVTAEVLQLQGKLGEAAARSFDAANESLRKTLTSNQETGALAQLDTKRRLTIAQAEYNAQQTEAQRITEGLGIVEARVALAEKLGATSTLGALQQVGAARQAAVVQMQAIVEAEEAIARASGSPALVQQAEKSRLALEQLRASADVVGERFKTIFESAGSDAFADFISGSKTASQAFSSFANSILRDLSRIAAQQITSGLTAKGGLVDSLIGAVGSYFGVKGTPQSGGYAGSGLTGDFARLDRATPLASGTNYVPYDGMPAILHKGEAVVPAPYNPAAGRLGVVAQGARGGDVIVNVHNSAGAQVETRETTRPDGSRQIDLLITAAKRAVARDIQAGGEVASAMQGTYGLNRGAGVMRGA
jgi:hypothetical protein